jgi:hypothetical protein
MFSGPFYIGTHIAIASAASPCLACVHAWNQSIFFSLVLIPRMPRQERPSFARLRTASECLTMRKKKEKQHMILGNILLFVVRGHIIQYNYRYIEEGLEEGAFRRSLFLARSRLFRERRSSLRTESVCQRAYCSRSQRQGCVCMCVVGNVVLKSTMMLRGADLAPEDSSRKGLD